MSFAKIQQEDRRLVILILLLQSDQYSANEHLIRSMLDAWAHNIGRDLMRSELAWLAEQGLVQVSTLSDLQVAKLTGRGKDVAEGRTIVPGVKKPEPGE